MSKAIHHSYFQGQEAPQCGELGPDVGRRVQGSPGKRGEKGEKGEPVYEKVNERIAQALNTDQLNERIVKMIDEKLKAGDLRKIKALEEKIDRLSETLYGAMSGNTETVMAALQVVKESNEMLEARVKALEENTDSSAAQKSPDIAPTSSSQNKGKLLDERDKRCKVMTSRSCYWTIIRETEDMDFDLARKLCKRQGGDVGGIESEIHYNFMMTHIRQQMPATSTSSLVWIGLTIDTATRDVQLLDGEEAPFEKWIPRLPHGAKTFTHIVLVVEEDTTAPRQGMENLPPSFKRHGVLCEIKRQ